jgi:hypothetical protein
MLRLDQITPNNLIDSDDLGAQGTTNLPLPEVSTAAIAHAELVDFQSSALAETQEDLSFALGGRLRDLRRGPGTQENVRGRVLAHKLIAEIDSVDPITLTALLAALQQQTPDPGQAALQLAAVLARGKPNATLRRRMEGALAELAADDAMSLSLFGALEFGACTPGLVHELRRLYHRANAQHQKMSQWLSSLGERSERKRKLRTMLRVLSYELSVSGQAIVGSNNCCASSDWKPIAIRQPTPWHCRPSMATPCFGISWD